MKKTLMLLLAVFSAVVLRAQDYFPGADPQPYPPFADSWKADPMMVTGNYRMYRMDTPALLRPERPVRYPGPAVRCRGAERRPYG